MKTVIQPLPLTRREYAYYFFSATLTVLGAALLAGVFWMMLPASHRVFIGDVSDFPPSDQPYRVFIDRSLLYLVSTGDALVVLNPIIIRPTRSCRVVWVPVNARFEDPCWGAKFDLHGNYLSGPASRGMDQYPLRIKKNQVWVDLLRTIPGAPRPTPIP